MSDNMSADNGSGVSPTRKKVSAAILVVLLIVLVIEVRAGLGQSWSGQALVDVAGEEGVFETADVTVEQVEALMSLAPSKDLVRESPQELEYEYAWTSLLRPVMQKGTPALYVVFSNTDEPRAIRFGTEPPSQEELDFANRPSVEPDPSTEQNMDAMMGGSAPSGGSHDAEAGAPGSGGDESEAEAPPKANPLDADASEPEPES